MPRCVSRYRDHNSQETSLRIYPRRSIEGFILPSRTNQRQQLVKKDLVARTSEMKTINQQTPQLFTVPHFLRAKHPRTLDIARVQRNSLLHHRRPKINQDDLLVFELGRHLSDRIRVLGCDSLEPSDSRDALHAVIYLELDLIDGRRGHEEDRRLVGGDRGVCEDRFDVGAVFIQRDVLACWAGGQTGVVRANEEELCSSEAGPSSTN